jgi:hypothetical protein
MNLRYPFSFLIILIAGVQLYAQVRFSADDTIGCRPLQVKFSLDYTSIDTNTAASVDWDFGNGTTITSFNPPPVTYTDSGDFTVSIVVNGDVANPITKTNYIHVHYPLPSDFTFEMTDSALMYGFIPSEPITDTAAQYFYRWDYYYNNARLRNITYFIHNESQNNAIDTMVFPNTGQFGATLTIRDLYGCTDSTFQMFYVTMPVDTTQPFQVGNVFSTKSNDYFVIDPHDPAVILRIEIYSRTGILVYKAESPAIFWDGRTNNGQELGTGVYYYVMEAIQGDTRGYYTTRGFIHLFR